MGDFIRTQGSLSPENQAPDRSVSSAEQSAGSFWLSGEKERGREGGREEAEGGDRELP